MAKKFSELYNKIPAERRARIEEGVREEHRKIALSEMRKARSLTQNAIAEQLHIDQGAVSRLEKRTDMYLSTLRSYIEATGGRLEVRAVYADETINLELSSQ
jgi:DNA-directed RNA polymerase specialized sigma subunit